MYTICKQSYTTFSVFNVNFRFSYGQRFYMVYDMYVYISGLHVVYTHTQNSHIRSWPIGLIM